MKSLIYGLMIMLLSSCAATTKYIEVPVETVKTEYRNSIQSDTVYVRDSVIIYNKGDTVYVEKYRSESAKSQKKDTITIVDSIPVVVTNTVTETVTINKLYYWQKTLMVLGALFVILIIYKFVKK
jgi:hypothetical protein